MGHSIKIPSIILSTWCYIDKYPLTDTQEYPLLKLVNKINVFKLGHLN